MKCKRALFETACLLLLLLFVYTGSSKLLGVDRFREQLGLVPGLAHWAPLLSVMIPVAELLAGVLLVFPGTRRRGLWAASVLMGIFSIYVGVILLGPAAARPCACGGVLRQLGWRAHFWFNLFFTILAWASLYFSCTRKRESAENL